MPKSIDDVLVLLPGITGSVLQKNGHDVWAPTPDALAQILMTGAKSLRDLALNGDDPEADDLGDGVTATRLVDDVHLIPGLWKIDGYSTTRARLRAAFDLQEGKNYFEFPYDWRRDNRAAARLLSNKARKWVEDRRKTNPQARLVLLAHSMGGLVARHFLEVLGGWEIARTLITFGTPYQGAPKALGFVSNGYKMGLGPLSFDFSDVMLSFTSVYQLLPDYACYDDGSGALKHVADAVNVPNLDRKRAADARSFHGTIDDAAARRRSGNQDPGYVTYPIVGREQPTWQSGVLRNGGVELLAQLGGTDSGGDGTVPQVSASPKEQFNDGREMYQPTAHGTLQAADAVLAHVEGILDRPSVAPPKYRAPSNKVALSLRIDDAYRPGPIKVTVRPLDGVRTGLVAKIEDIASKKAQDYKLPTVLSGGWHEGTTGPLPQGVYRVTVTGGRADGTTAIAVSDVFAVLG